MYLNYTNNFITYHHPPSFSHCYINHSHTNTPSFNSSLHHLPPRTSFTPSSRHSFPNTIKILQHLLCIPSLALNYTIHLRHNSSITPQAPIFIPLNHHSPLHSIMNPRLHHLFQFPSLTPSQSLTSYHNHTVTTPPSSTTNSSITTPVHCTSTIHTVSYYPTFHHLNRHPNFFPHPTTTPYSSIKNPYNPT